MAIMHILLFSNSRNRNLIGIYQTLTQELIHGIEVLKNMSENDRNIATAAYSLRMEEAFKRTDEDFWKVPEEDNSIQQAA